MCVCDCWMQDPDAKPCADDPKYIEVARKVLARMGTGISPEMQLKLWQKAIRKAYRKYYKVWSHRRDRTKRARFAVATHRRLSVRNGPAAPLSRRRAPHTGSWLGRLLTCCQVTSLTNTRVGYARVLYQGVGPARSRVTHTARGL